MDFARQNSENKTPHVAYYGIRGGKGGLNPVLRNLINKSAGMGIKCTLLVHNAPEEIDLLHDDVNVVSLPDTPKDLRFIPLAFYLRRHCPTHILSNREWGNWSAMLAKALARSSAKLVYRVGNPLDATLERRNFIKKMLRKNKILMSYKWADLIICNSQKIREDVISLTKAASEKVVVLNNPTVTNEIFQLADTPPAVPIPLAPDEKAIVAIGRLARQKAFDVLINAFALVTTCIPARLVIVGSGKEHDSLIQLARTLKIEERVHLVGFQKNPFPYLKLASLFVLSSTWEGSPNVLIEALALGVPSVATDCPTGPREILREGRFGRLVSVGDVKSMAEAMLETLKSPPPPSFLKRAAEPYWAETATVAYLKAMGVLP